MCESRTACAVRRATDGAGSVCSDGDLYRAVVVAVAVVPVMQASVDQIVEVIAVRHALVPASVVPALAGDGGAGVRVGRVDGDHVLVVVAIVFGVQVPVVQVVDVSVVQDTGVAAVCAVHVRMVGMNGV